MTHDLHPPKRANAPRPLALAIAIENEYIKYGMPFLKRAPHDKSLIRLELPATASTPIDAPTTAMETRTHDLIR